MARSKNEKTGTTSTKKGGIGGRLGNLNTWERIGGILAILLFFFSIYLLISFISFFISGGVDISHLNITPKNYCRIQMLKFRMLVDAGVQ